MVQTILLVIILLIILFLLFLFFPWDCLSDDPPPSPSHRFSEDGIISIGPSISGWSPREDLRRFLERERLKEAKKRPPTTSSHG